MSDAESELGLGTVVALDVRMVTLFFPASGENRLYTRNNPPITRVMFNPGDTIHCQEGWQLKIDQVNEDNGLLTYTGTRLDTQTADVVMREIMLDSKLTFSKPQDRLFAGQTDRMDRFALRYRARQHLSEQCRMPWSGLRGMRASLIPHQLHIAHQVGQRHAPRVLLADEVGLGKTIEAGMIIHQQLLTGRAGRILIVVPASLQYQWLVEMMRRFNLYFSLFDDQRYTEARLDSSNPFETEQLVICSLDFVCQNKRRLEQLIEAQWDLLVVDEAHSLEWSEEAPSQQYQVIAQLATQIPGLLLLTATPEQLGQPSHFARLRLLDPSRFHDYQAFISEQQQYRPVADVVTLLLGNDTLSSHHLSLLSELLDQPDIGSALEAANRDGDERHTARQELVKRLLDRHGTSRVLFRNTRQGVKGFPQRCLHQIQLPLPAQYQTAIKVYAMLNSQKDQQQGARDMLYPEHIYQSFGGDDATWWDFDPRVEWLLNYLIGHRDEKILVICTKASTVQHLEQVLREREAIRSAVFHEGLSLIERDRAAAYFASVEEGAQVLLCSEIGSEGRNFQFARHLVMFDLPCNPDLLEQRIGRLDRIGQSGNIQIMVPYLENTAQAMLFRWLHESLDAFEHTCPTGRAIYDNVCAELIHFLANPTQQEGFDVFIQHCREQHEILKLQLEQGRDRLLEIHSNGGEGAQLLATSIAKQESDIALVSFALNLFDIVGINQEDHSDNLIMLTPSDHMLVPDFPGIPPDGCTITFDREQALSREDAQFLSWEHPIIRNGLDLIVSGDIGSCAVSLLKNKALPVGTLLLELIYVLEAQAPKQLQLTRFLPPTPVRMLLDQQGNNLAAQVEFEHFNRQLSPVNRHTSNKLVNVVQGEIHAILQFGENMIAQQAQTLINQARQEADKTLNAEWSRLEALRAVNPNIRDDELCALKQYHEDTITHLQQATWRLDALRVIAVSHQ